MIAMTDRQFIWNVSVISEAIKLRGHSLLGAELNRASELALKIFSSLFGSAFKFRSK
jgi:hypothetical protein